ncbi:hypothetical protein [Paracoccus sp. (in: a-proteobacteria)]|uniref:hypothetical protein n=1 Tax=Paracoccus sp. TaxID=267 RepID=UPI0026E0B9AB|nr:hypothetical protein [Paracoccus sp. (in: a-proteobacteria)]MDO5648847.1 hypothetical protein [Paracoccus sp. (in: a-proteobacteria)]
MTFPKFPISILTTGANVALPGLPAWHAASFWAQLLLVLSVICNAAGIDLFALLFAMGIGSTPDEVIATGHRAVSAVQELLPLIFGLWAWLERAAPNYRLKFW